jgi:PIN domain nuclease of toxin-antitoxin system
MSVFVTDTHPLVWYATKKYSSLSKKALRAFQQADDGDVLIYIPPVVLWEVAILEKLGKIRMQSGFAQWSTALFNQTGFAETSFDAAIIRQAIGYNFNDDIFDAVIVATAVSLEFPLITKDVAISEANLAAIYW